MGQPFFTSDTHGFHANIASTTTSKWKGDNQVRPFGSIEDMNEELIKNINKMVKPDDELYHLGDWTFGGIDKIWEFRKRINCHNIHLILGNHDHHIEDNKVLPNVIWDGYPGWSHLEDKDTANSPFADAKAKELFDSVSHYKKITVDKTPVILSHYSHRVWHGSHKGWFHLYGHSHNSLETVPYGKSMDVGVDAAYARFGEFRPFAWNEIKSILDKRTIEFPDHHNKNTNT